MPQKKTRRSPFPGSAIVCLVPAAAAGVPGGGLVAATAAADTAVAEQKQQNEDPDLVIVAHKGVPPERFWRNIRSFHGIPPA